MILLKLLDLYVYIKVAQYSKRNRLSFFVLFNFNFFIIKKPTTLLYLVCIVTKANSPRITRQIPRQ